MAEYIDKQEFLEEQRHLYCENCEKRKGMKRGKMRFVYEIGDAPCRSCGYGDVLDDLEDIPAADVRPVEWIPVTERLPKEGESVLVHGNLYPNKHDGGVIAVSKRMDWNYWQGFGREINITHWMPLPQPPKEE